MSEKRTPVPDKRPRPDVETLTEPQVKKMVDAVHEDLAKASKALTEGWAIIGAVETVSRGINALSSSCRAWGNQLEEILQQIENECASVEKKMIGNGTSTEIVQSVDQARVKLLREAVVMDTEGGS